MPRFRDPVREHPADDGSERVGEARADPRNVSGHGGLTIEERIAAGQNTKQGVLLFPRRRPSPLDPVAGLPMWCHGVGLPSLRPPATRP